MQLSIAIIRFIHGSLMTLYFEDCLINLLQETVGRVTLLFLPKGTSFFRMRRKTEINVMGFCLRNCCHRKWHSWQAENLAFQNRSLHVRLGQSNWPLAEHETKLPTEPKSHDRWKNMRGKHSSTSNVHMGRFDNSAETKHHVYFHGFPFFNLMQVERIWAPFDSPRIWMSSVTSRLLGISKYRFFIRSSNKGLEPELGVKSKIFSQSPFV